MEGKPGPGERSVRFAFGATFGFALGFLDLSWFSVSPLLHLLLAAAHAVILGFLALRYGDRFWEFLSRVIRWPYR